MRRPVPQGEVVRHWLRRESRKPDVSIDPERPTGTWDLVGTLLGLRPFQAAFLWRYPVAWYRTTLTERQFRRLRVIDGPPDRSWRKLSPDRTIVGAAERILDEGLERAYEDVDVDYIRRTARRPSDTEPGERIIAFRPDPDGPPYVVDGNHRATATAVRLVADGDYRSQAVYLGEGRPVGWKGVDLRPDAEERPWWIGLR